MGILPTGVLGFGGAVIAGKGGGYSFGGLEEQESIALVRDAYELGVRSFDSAPIYGFGESERRLGRALKNYRDQVQITTKSGITWDQSKRVTISNTPAITEKMLTQSLRDLDTDYVDLYMIHWPDPKTDIRRPMEVYARAKNKGQISHIGLCNTNPSDFAKACEVAPVEVAQFQVNPFESPESAFMDELKKQGVLIQGWGVLDKGILTGSVNKKREQSKDYAPGDYRSKAPRWESKKVLEKIEQVEKVKPIVENLGYSLLRWAISYAVNYKRIDQVLLGARTAGQWKQVLDAANELMPLDALEEVMEKWSD